MKPYTILSVLNNVTKYISLNVFSFNTRSWLIRIPLKYYSLKLLSNIITRIYDLSRFVSQKTLIEMRDWDALVVLDACRYDIFSQEVYKYLDGELKPVVSPASVTIDWLKTVWESDMWKDVVYVSATPFVNKRGLLKDFDARKVFKEVIEVWDWGWNEELMTVPPENMSMGVRIVLTKMKLKRLKFPKDYKLVIHYVQPHAPYLAFQSIVSKISRIRELKEQILDVTVRELKKFTGKFSIDHILLGLLKEHLESNNEVIKALECLYRDNLKQSLKAIASLLDHINGNIIITADHGELLGEYGLFFHLDVPLPQLRIVPWFKVKQ